MPCVLAPYGTSLGFLSEQAGGPPFFSQYFPLVTVDQYTIMFDPGETGVRERARGRGTPMGRWIPQAFSCNNRYEHLMERNCGPLTQEIDRSGNCEMKFDSCQN